MRMMIFMMTLCSVFISLLHLYWIDTNNIPQWSVLFLAKIVFLLEEKNVSIIGIILSSLQFIRWKRF